MQSVTKQLEKWQSQFGKEYTDRNTVTVDGLDQLYMTNFGLTRRSLNEEFLGKLNRSIRILEVGANTGNQLLALQNMGFENLYGVEPQSYAVESAKERSKGINLIQGNAFDLPFKDGYFDLVFTSGVLIHISPKDIKKAISEIHRCSKTYIWGMEYFAEDYEQVVYRGNKDLLWKTDFAQLYVDTFKGLKLVKEKRFKYLTSDNADTMYLLKKTGTK